MVRPTMIRRSRVRETWAMVTVTTNREQQLQETPHGVLLNNNAGAGEIPLKIDTLKS